MFPVVDHHHHHIIIIVRPIRNIGRDVTDFDLMNKFAEEFK